MSAQCTLHTDKCSAMKRMPREINNCVKSFFASVPFVERVSSFVFQFNRTLGHARFVYKKINTFEQFSNMSINSEFDGINRAESNNKQNTA